MTRSMLPEKVRNLGSALFRRSSGSSASSTGDHQHHPSPTLERNRRPASARSRSSLVVPKAKGTSIRETVPEEEDDDQSQSELLSSQIAPGTSGVAETLSASSRLDVHAAQQPHASPLPLPTPDPSPLSLPENATESDCPALTIQLPSPPHQRDDSTRDHDRATRSTSTGTAVTARVASPRSPQLETTSGARPGSAGRRSLLESRPRSPLYQTFLAREQVGGSEPSLVPQALSRSLEQSSRDIDSQDYFTTSPSTYSVRPPTPPNMAQSPGRYQQYMQPQARKRRIWVKRPGASATMVSINEDDMVDDARDMILRKYANSLGRSFDSPDVTLRIHPRQQAQSASQRSSSAQQTTPSPLQEERVLRPDEVLSRTIDVYFPGGQSVEEALLIDVPVPAFSQHRPKRTPRGSPQVHNTHYSASNTHYDNLRPSESDTEYFPAVLAPQRGTSGAHSPGVIGQLPILGPDNRTHSIAVLNGVQLPPIPSPGGTERNLVGTSGENKRRAGRPKYGRTHTSSPTIVQTSAHSGEGRPNIASATTAPPPAPPLGTPPVPIPGFPLAPRTATPPPRIGSPRPGRRKPTKKSFAAGTVTPANPGSAGALRVVPPINVLVVEDNIINLKLLEAFLKRLKVRSHSAMNGRDAVNKWRQGGFHLVLMDIQLPIMNGLDATKEIRRLEKVNDVGAFVKSAEEEQAEKGQGSTEISQDQSDTPQGPDEIEKEKERNKLGNRELFKSPVIIVALTASSLHSDRSEALAAGCNDFLTKPVDLGWLERKLKEWGCMQALIDFDGWRQWKDFQSAAADANSASKAKGSGHKASNSMSSQKTAMGTYKAAQTSAELSASTSTIKASSAGTNAMSALQEHHAHTESQESTATLDSMTSDDADSIDTALPPRSSGKPGSSPALSAGPSVTVQAPTPRASVEGSQTPRIDTKSSAMRSASTSPKLDSAGASPRSLSSVSMNSPADGLSEGRERDRSSERRKRGKRSSLGHSGLTAVEERDGEEGRGEVEVNA